MSKYKELLSYIEEKPTFPILVSDIMAWLVNQGYQDEINLRPVPLSNKVYAYVKRRSEMQTVYGDSTWVTDINFKQDLNDCWKRLVCTKELMHFFDPVSSQVKNKESAEKLFSDLALETSGGTARSEAGISDMQALYKALYCLAPVHAVEEIRPKYQSKELTPNQIALFFKIPEKFIGMIFSDDYIQTYSDLN